MRSNVKDAGTARRRLWGGAALVASLLTSGYRAAGADRLPSSRQAACSRPEKTRKWWPGDAE